MADGTTKPISEVEVGDWVLAEDPETGERGPRRVTHLWMPLGHDVATTEDHPFWNATDGEWQRADALDPSQAGGAQHGVEFVFDNADGVTTRIRIHGPDGTAPPGSNAATGDVMRIQVGGRYMDASGNLHPRGVTNPRSPYYDEVLANEFHIPWQR